MLQIARVANYTCNKLHMLLEQNTNDKILQSVPQNMPNIGIAQLL